MHWPSTTTYGGHRMHLGTTAGVTGLLYSLAASAGWAADVVTGDRATAAGVAAVIGAVATGSALLLYRSSQASAAAHAELMERLRLELAEHAATRARLDTSERRQGDTERKLDRAEHKLVVTEHKLVVTEHKLVVTEHKLAATEAEVERLRHRLEELTDQRD